MKLDRRLAAFRDDLADIRLKGAVEAARYVEGRPARLIEPVVPCLRHPSPDAPLDSEFLFGEPLLVFDEADGFSWVQSLADGYVGYVPSHTLGPGGPDATHVVTAPMALVYGAPSIKSPVLMRLPQMAALALGPQEQVGSERVHAVSSGGFILAQHVAPVGTHEPDYVDVAARYLGTPYLFGGKSWFGIDCSALVQVALKATGYDAPRDSDMQAHAVGEPLDDQTRTFQRGDLVFWRGHVGIMADAATLLHANGHHMATATEPVAKALARLAGLGLTPIAVRRLDASARQRHLSKERADPS
ncbi:MAG: NlpC/P60 family protein [Pseudomonadota bacterium]